MAKKLTSNVYFDAKTKYDKEHGWHIVDGKDGCLFSKSGRQTSVRPEDLPEWYYKQTWGFNRYINTKGVKDLVYKPNLWINHLFRDDYLYISYDKPIETIKDVFGGESYTGYDIQVWSSDIVYILKKIRKNSNFDTSKIEEQIIEKAKLFNEKYSDSGENIEISRLKELLK